MLYKRHVLLRVNDFLTKCDWKQKSEQTIYIYIFKQTYTALSGKVVGLIPGGGALPLEGRMGMCRGHDPLFSGQSALPSLPIYHQCTVHVPPFSIFRKFCIFSLVLGQNFSSQDPKFLNFCSQDPSVFKENPLLRPYFWKPLRHIPTKKKKLSAPPPPGFDSCTSPCSIFLGRGLFQVYLSCLYVKLGLRNCLYAIKLTDKQTNLQTNRQTN